MGKRLFLLFLMFLTALTVAIIPGSKARADNIPVYDPSIVINAPIAGEVLTAGSSYQIKWSCKDSFGIYIFYSSNGGTTWNKLEHNWFISGTSSYIWTVPIDTTDQGRIRVKISKAGTGPPITFYDFYNDTGNFKITNSVNSPVELRPPSKLTSTAISNSEIDLAWTDKSHNESGFHIYRRLEGSPGYTTVGRVGPGVVTFKDIGLEPSTPYCYVVTAYNDQGSSVYSNEASANTGLILSQVPAAPSGLVATAVSSASIQLSWQDNANNETGFYIFRKTQGTSYNNIATIGADSTGYTDTGLTPGT
ncbi:MAG: fibronectin type III domain-containing protein, partial [Chitinophagales bacterium]